MRKLRAASLLFIADSQTFLHSAYTSMCAYLWFVKTFVYLLELFFYITTILNLCLRSPCRFIRAVVAPVFCHWNYAKQNAPMQMAIRLSHNTCKYFFNCHKRGSEWVVQGCFRLNGTFFAWEFRAHRTRQRFFIIQFRCIKFRYYLSIAFHDFGLIVLLKNYS